MNKILSLLSLLLAVFFTGCQMDEREDKLLTTDSNDNGFMLSYHVSGLTRSSVPSEGEENEIQTLYLLFFESSRMQTGEFIEAIDAKSLYETELGNSGILSIDFDASSKLNKSTAYNLLVCANIDDYLAKPITGVEDINERFVGVRQLELMQTLMLEVGGVPQSSNEHLDNSNQIFSNKLPMSTTATKGANEEMVTIEFNRAVSRFDVECTAAGYQLVSASIWNAYPETTVWESAYNKYPIVKRTERFYGVTSVNEETNSINGALYSFENVVGEPLQNDNVTTCLIIGLSDGKDTYYYRVNINAASIGQQLKRNNIYQTTIKNVISKGAVTERDAYNGNEFLLDIDINGWILDTNGCIQYDGENILAIPTQIINILPSGGTSEFNIFTLGNEELKLSNVQCPTGINVKLIGSKLFIDAEATSVDKEGYVEVSFGSLKATIHLIQGAQVSSEFVKLSVSSLPAFSSGNDGVSELISVESTGEWIATIFCNDGDYFSFNENKSLIETAGTSGNGFNLYTIEANDKLKNRYAFVHVRLKDNEEVGQVLVLTQKGIGGLQITPSVESVAFDAFGKTYSSKSDYFEFSVEAYETDDSGNVLPWEVSLLTGTNKFIIERDASEDKFRIRANFNSTVSGLSGKVRVGLTNNPNVYKDITITQVSHALTLSNVSFPTISQLGGSTDPITVTSTHTWRAEITSTNGSAYFNNNKATTLTGKSGESFVVTFPELKKSGIKPVATIKVTVDGTNIQRSFTVTQGALAEQTLVLHSRKNYYGSLFHHGSLSYNFKHIYQLSSNLRDSKVVGPAGTVYMPASYNFIFTKNHAAPVENADIFQTVSYSITKKDFQEIKTWKDKSDKRILFLTHDYHAKETMAGLTDGLGIKGYVAKNSVNNAAKNTRYFNKDSKYTVANNKLVEYLMKTGPFTAGKEIKKSEIVLRAYNSSNTALTSWPSTFIPLIMANDTQCIFGIDPTNKIIFLGDTDIFGNYGASAVNYDGTYPANMKFLNNFIAWMTNAALYGDAFIDDFK